MPRGQILMDYQKEQIDYLSSPGTSYRKIAAEIGKSLHSGIKLSTPERHLWRKAILREEGQAGQSY